MSLFYSAIISPKSVISPKRKKSMGTTLKFYINKRRMNQQINGYPIYLRIIHNLKKAEGKISLTPVKESEINYWIDESQRFNSKQKQFLSYNILLNEIQNEFHSYLRDNLTTISEKTPHEIRNHLLSRNLEDKITVFEAVNNFYTDTILPDIDKALGTKRNYRKCINHFCNFLKNNKLESLAVSDFKKFHASKFVDYLKKPNSRFKKKALNGQTVNSIVKNIKPFFGKLHFEEEININPFVGIKTPFKRTNKPRLTNKNFKSIVILDLKEKPTLEVYRDLFVFLCYTGLSYCDAIDLKYSDIENGCFSLRRKKSKVMTKQFLTIQVISILSKYEGKLPENRLLPKRSLDKLNLNLKVIAAMTGVEFSLCTYTARRFFRQSIFESGINESLVIKTLMGHTRSNDIDSHYFYIDDAILIKAKKKLQKHFKRIVK